MWAKTMLFVFKCLQRISPLTNLLAVLKEHVKMILLVLLKRTRDDNSEQMYLLAMLYFE